MKIQPKHEKPKDICGASAPVAGLLGLAAKTPPDAAEAAEILRQLRAGAFDAACVSIPGGRRPITYCVPAVDAFMPILARAIRVPAYGQADPRGWCADRLGHLFLRLVVAVDRLRRNTKAEANKVSGT